MRARWYSQAPSQFRESSDELEVTFARLRHKLWQFDFWSESGEYLVYQGPPFIPMWSIEPPILNASPVNFHWRIRFPKEYKGKLIIPKSVFVMRSKGRTFDITSGILIRYEQKDELGNNLDYITHHEHQPLPEFIEILRDCTIELNYGSLVYSKEEYYVLKPVFIIENKRQILPALHFTPDREYSYSPFEIPFAYPPLR